jgi:hypothetical protein
MTKRHNKNVYDIIHNEAVERSVAYIKKHLDTAMITDDSWWDTILHRIKQPGLCLEFGVYKGDSLNYFASFRPDIHWYGFDSFEGLQEDWIKGYYGKKFFTLNGNIPNLKSNITPIKGWFKDTLTPFLRNHNDDISYMHIDCDTYTSTKDILDRIDPSRFFKGSLIHFDEYMGYHGWEDHEFKPWQEYVKEHGIKYKYVLFSFMAVLVEIQ